MSSSLDPTLRSLNDCGCCDGLTVETPVAIENRPGLSAIAYRIGTHSRFKASLLARLSAADLPALRDLKTRDPQDFTIALLDAWAMVADVLTFYQEQIANEAYVRTATERRSLQSLAELVGYQPRPGVAASTYLAFTVDDSDPALQVAPVESGTKVQSIPAPGERPQIFETIERIAARPEWNAMRPRLTQPHPMLSSGTQTLTVKGVASNLAPGDSILLVTGSGRSDRDVRRIQRIHINATAQTTQIDLVDDPPDPPPFVIVYLAVAQFFTLSRPLNNDIVKTQVLNQRWRQADLSALAKVQQWSLRALTLNINSQINSQVARRDLPTTTGAFAFRQRAAVFGHNAPKYDDLPPNTRPLGNWEGRTLKEEAGITGAITPQTLGRVDLDSVNPRVLTGSWVVLESPNYRQVYQVQDNSELSRSGFTLSAKVTRLRLEHAADFNHFTLRDTTVLAQSERLTLVELPIAEPVQGNHLVLDRLYLELQVGRPVVISGEREDLEGVEASEVVILAEVIFNNGYTELTFQTSLQHRYVRTTVTVNANVAIATHGETKTEVLGSGNASLAFQQFSLHHLPLTYTSAATATGAVPTLQIYVNGLQWQEVSTFYGHGPEERIYRIRPGEAGTTTVQFGNGRTGARLPTGQENVQAVYRQGMGEAGLLQEKQLSLLLTRPLGIRSVSNPIAPANAADPETLEEIRANAALTIRTLNRIVSLQDYEDFARAFTGVAKALATWTWDGRQRGVFVTVAGVQGSTIEPTSLLYQNLLTAMQQAGDSLVPLDVKTYRPAFFLLSGKLKIDPVYQTPDVLAQVEQALRQAFGFATRQFGQPVAASEVMWVIQQVKGVIAVDLDQLYRTDAPLKDQGTLQPLLLASAPQAGTDTAIAAELLLLDPRPLMLGGM